MYLSLFSMKSDKFAFGLVPNSSLHTDCPALCACSHFVKLNAKEGQPIFIVRLVNIKIKLAKFQQYGEFINLGGYQI